MQHKKSWISVVVGIVIVIVIYKAISSVISDNFIIIGNSHAMSKFFTTFSIVPVGIFVFVGVSIFSIISSNLKHKGNCGGSNCHTENHSDNNTTYNDSEMNNNSGTYNNGDVFEEKRYKAYTPPPVLRCPMCSSVVTDDQKFCINCGNKLKDN